MSVVPEGPIEKFAELSVCQQSDYGVSSVLGMTPPLRRLITDQPAG